MVMDRAMHRAAVEAGYANVKDYVEQWSPSMVEDTQKRYADDITLQELVRLRVENERLREALQKIAEWPDYRLPSHRDIARSALQQKESE